MKHTPICLFTLIALSGSAFADSPFATEVVASTNLPGTGLYDSPQAVLGKPSTVFKNLPGPGVSGNGRVKLVEAAYNTDPSGNKLITTINKGQSVTVKFDHQVTNDPTNPFGLDFIVFGNAFFTSNGFVSDASNMNTLKVTGGAFLEPLQISVSPDNVSWYTYASGPYGDSLFPTQAYRWDRTGAKWTDQEMDFTKPVNPSLTQSSFAGLTGADAIDLYNGSGGGTGFDLAPSGFSSIQYIRVTGVDGFAGGEIDAFADVAGTAAPVPEPISFIALGLGVAAMVRRRR